LKTYYTLSDDGSCIRIRIDDNIVAIVEDYHYGGHVHAAILQLLEELEEMHETVKIYEDKEM
jgi:hypothetical protein